MVSTSCLHEIRKTFLPTFGRYNERVGIKSERLCLSVSALSKKPFLPTFDRFNERICIKSETFSSYFQLCLH